MNKEKEFEWTDELVKEFGRFTKSYISSTDNEVAFNKFKEKKIKEEEKPVVTISDDSRIWLNFGKDKTFEISKERLYEILIAEQNKALSIIVDKAANLYTEKEYIEFGEKCFNAARERCFNGLNSIGNSFLYPAKYDTFSDYMNSINDK